METALLLALEEVYGKANSKGFGSAVFFEASFAGNDLNAIALSHYKQFMGNKWNNDTAARWEQGWKLVFERSTNTITNILVEMNGIKDEDAKRSVPLLTELVENAEQGKLAIAAAFNNDTIQQLHLFTVGDGEAMAGLLLCGLYKDQSVCSVICLMD